MPFILAIDDDPEYLKDFSMALEGKANFKAFTGPCDFEYNVKKDDIEQANLIIVDYHFKIGTSIDCNIAAYIRKKLGFKGKILLCSSHSDFKRDNENVKREFDGVIHKGTFDWDSVFPHL